MTFAPESFPPDGFAPDSFAALDTIAEDFQQRGGQPGLAYGVVAGGRLVHARGLGERSLDAPRRAPERCSGSPP